MLLMLAFLLFMLANFQISHQQKVVENDEMGFVENKENFNKLLRFLFLNSVNEMNRARKNKEEFFESEKDYSHITLENATEMLDWLKRFSVENLLEEKMGQQGFNCRIRENEEKGLNFATAIRSFKKKSFGLLLKLDLFRHSDSSADAQLFKLLFSFAARVASNPGLSFEKENESVTATSIFLTAYKCLMPAACGKEGEQPSSQSEHQNIFDERIELLLEEKQFALLFEGRRPFSQGLLVRWNTPESERHKYSDNFGTLLRLSNATVTPYEATNFLTQMLAASAAREKENGELLFTLNPAGKRTPFDELLLHLAQRTGSDQKSAGDGQVQFASGSKESCEARQFLLNLSERIQHEPTRAKTYFEHLQNPSAEGISLEKRLKNKAHEISILLKKECEKLKESVRKIYVDNEIFLHYENSLILDLNPWNTLFQFAEKISSGLMENDAQSMSQENGANNGEGHVPMFSDVNYAHKQYMHLLQMKSMELPTLSRHFKRLQRMTPKIEMEMRHKLVLKTMELLKWTLRVDLVDEFAQYKAENIALILRALLRKLAKLVELRTAGRWLVEAVKEEPRSGEKSESLFWRITMTAIGVNQLQLAFKMFGPNWHFADELISVHQLLDSEELRDQLVVGVIEDMENKGQLEKADKVSAVLDHVRSVLAEFNLNNNLLQEDRTKMEKLEKEAVELEEELRDHFGGNVGNIENQFKSILGRIKRLCKKWAEN